MFEVFAGQSRTGRAFDFVNLDEQHLGERIVGPWDQGTPVTYDGKTVDSTRSSIQIFETDESLSAEALAAGFFGALEASGARDVTNDLILGPTGWKAREMTQVETTSVEAVSPLRDRRRVMVVYGRNQTARDQMFMFLRALRLDPIEWEEAVAETGLASPHNLDTVRAAMDVGQAVVVLLTAEDQAGLLPELAEGDDPDVVLRGQPRQNVILEAGLAMGVDRSRTILVELGPIRRASDFEGLNVVRLTNAAATRSALRSRLQSAGCEVSEVASDWMRPEVGGDFDNAAVAWEAQAPTGVGMVFGLPSNELRGEVAELSLRAYGLDEGAVVNCAVTSPIGHIAAVEPAAVPAGGGMTLYSTAYPTSFEGASTVAGFHAVTWSVTEHGGAVRELARDDFRFP